MAEIDKTEDLAKKQDVLLKKVDQILEEIDLILPPNWTRSQVASVFTVYMEFYKSTK